MQTLTVYLLSQSDFRHDFFDVFTQLHKSMLEHLGAVITAEELSDNLVRARIHGIIISRPRKKTLIELYKILMEISESKVPLFNTNKVIDKSGANVIENIFKLTQFAKDNESSINKWYKEPTLVPEAFEDWKNIFFPSIAWDNIEGKEFGLLADFLVNTLKNLSKKGGKYKYDFSVFSAEKIPKEVEAIMPEPIKAMFHQPKILARAIEANNAIEKVYEEAKTCEILENGKNLSSYLEKNNWRLSGFTHYMEVSKILFDKKRKSEKNLGDADLNNLQDVFKKHFLFMRKDVVEKFVDGYEKKLVGKFFGIRKFNEKKLVDYIKNFLQEEHPYDLVKLNQTTRGSLAQNTIRSRSCTHLPVIKIDGQERLKLNSNVSSRIFLEKNEGKRETEEKQQTEQTHTQQTQDETANSKNTIWAEQTRRRSKTESDAKSKKRDLPTAMVQIEAYTVKNMP